MTRSRSSLAGMTLVEIIAAMAIAVLVLLNMQMVSEAGAETILVGDSLGMVLQGHDSTIPVTVDHMAYHTECVCRQCLLDIIIYDGDIT